MTGRQLRAVPALDPTVAATPLPSAPASRPLLRQVVGARLRRARAAQARSLREVAVAAGVSTGHLSQVERGLAEASSEVLRAVCRALGLPMSVLLRAASADLAAADLAAVDLTAVDLTGTPTLPLGASAPGDVQALAA